MSDFKSIVGQGVHQQESIATQEAIKDWARQVVEAGYEITPEFLDRDVQIHLNTNNPYVVYHYIVMVKWAKRRSWV